uniref:GST C-terminal domain-containing protein n=1 Tax=Arcella intermedia TaxID=1963864 RepID=A0A6B2L987_9EUKA
MSVHRNVISKGTRFEPEANRYHLYISTACPWASRCLALLYLKGLEEVIGLSIVHPTWAKTRPDPADTHTGWIFKDPSDPPVSNPGGHGSFNCEGCIPDTVNGARTIRELYDIANDTGGKYTVPLLWCKKEKAIVCNESELIMESFNSHFNDFAKHPEVDLLPAHLGEAMKEANSWIYPDINDGVYKCGFAKSQEAYEVAFDKLFAALDRLEDLLSRQRYICGDTLTASDIRAFVTLVRFDEVYVVYFKCNKKLIRTDYPNLYNYVKELYQMPAIGRSVDMRHIKTHYYTSHQLLNYYAVIPKGNPDQFSSPHDRNRFST